MKNLYKILLVTALVFSLGVDVAFAQTTTGASVYGGPNNTYYNVPAGYASYQGPIFYNASTQTYFNSLTGQYSGTAPVGSASIINGAYVIPSGYNPSVYGTYYNPSNGQYYDPATGFYSTTAPVGPSFYSGSIGGTVTNPGLPYTGEGGNAAWSLSLMVLAGVLVVFATTAWVSKVRTV